MSYAEIASKGPKQSPEEAAAPQPPQVKSTDSSASTSSLVDVDTPSVRTVPSDFDAQSVQTDTQAARIELEAEAEEAAARARAEADLARKKKAHHHHHDDKHAAAAAAADKARKAEGWIVRHLESITEGGAAGAVAAVNLLAVVGLSGWLGYRAWGMYDRGRLGAREVGLGLGVLGLVGAVEGVFVKFFNKAKANKGQ
ncbi:hypothetical protein BT67DRAFT_446256 [Trichocladium antarcticum]|uniref:Mitochondrial outer membrane protein OM14 C-terminal domain-containing protein n=1 Tax=Trichocladium antarcticum TaxID=1450529 RepID=A0AAN6Z8M6_9PEZI|nr:hypothetical protein BT67DRAFT_446256 [Trichocladium antarcticum]